LQLLHRDRDRALLVRGIAANRVTSWQIRVEGGVIHCKFVGPTPTDEIPGFIQALVKAMPESSARLVFDLRELEGKRCRSRAQGSCSICVSSKVTIQKPRLQYNGACVFSARLFRRFQPDYFVAALFEYSGVEG